MTITVLLFGHYRDAVKDSTFPLTLEEGVTVADVAAQLAAMNPRLSDLLQRTRYAVGAEFAKADTVLHDGDELAFLPPMSGG